MDGNGDFPGTTAVSYTAFESSRRLREASEAFFRRVEAGGWQQPEKLAELIAMFQEESTEALVVAAVTRVVADPALLLKVRHRTDRFNATITTLGRQIAGRLNREQVETVVRHLQNTCLAADGEYGTPRHYIGFPNSERLNARLDTLRTRMQADASPPDNVQVAETVNLLVNEWVQNMFLDVIRQLNLGIITKVLIQAGLMLARSLQRKAIRYVLHTARPERLPALIQHLDRQTLRVPAPLHFRYLYVAANSSGHTEAPTLQQH